MKTGAVVGIAALAAFIGGGVWYKKRQTKVAQFRAAIEKFMASDETNLAADRKLTGKTRSDMIDSLALIYADTNVQQMTYAYSQLMNRGYTQTAQAFKLRAESLGAPKAA